MFRTGVVFPQTEIEADPIVIRDFVQAVEDIGFSHLVAYDHVIGASIDDRPDWSGPYTVKDPFHEPMTLFGYLAGQTRHLGLMTGVVILPQRQTVLFGKQAAQVDFLSGGRLEVGVGTGWNQVEYEALGVDWATRGALMDDQIRVLRRLWTEPHFTERSRFHTISDAGINPMPIQRPIPIFLGGHAPAAMRRAAEKGDGWLTFFYADEAEKPLAEFWQAVTSAGREPASVRIENIVSMGRTMGGPIRTAEDAAADTEKWKRFGANGVAYHTTGMDLPNIDAHIALLRTIAEMVDLASADRMQTRRR